MTPFQAMLNAHTIDTLADFSRNDALAAGFSTAKVNQWQHLHDVYYGPAKANKQRAKALRRASEGRFSLDQLTLIENALKPVANPAARMRLRLRLLATAMNYKALRALIKQLVPKTTTAPKKGVRFTASRNRTRTMTVTADERDIADIEHLISRDIDPDRPASGQFLDNFLTTLRDGVGVPRAVPRPLLLIPLPDYTRIVAGDGDDITLGLTDGTTMTGAEYLTKHHADTIEVAAFHPQHGPVNLYRTERFANKKQRDLARAAMPICPVPGCRHGADSCEIHHITAWKFGGETNLDNLAPLCRYHNGTNDDDPTNPRRGRVENISGTPTWVSPRGYPAENTTHPYAPKRTLFARSAPAPAATVEPGHGAASL
ncbi:HNH endonuclease signature motif containing protein [Corynebacterium bouchesdurhonense]|uniref:HNH endonuclease signature motif containing protein n=1 Tax=Corynebacterium bouchesdurhonense TaxID=1720192 RepID=UPI00098F093E|nr:HNH endonuclease signature motif containing protein [Corynebacterium bouchesdurhonense]